jgi:hypothetical protein
MTIHHIITLVVLLLGVFTLFAAIAGSRIAGAIVILVMAYGVLATILQQITIAP